MNRLSRLPKATLMALMVLALLLVGSGIGLFSLVHGKQVATKNAHATATAAAVNATSTAVVNATTLPANATARVSWLQNTYDNVTNGTPKIGRASCRERV